MQTEFLYIQKHLQEAKERILPADCEERQLINKNNNLKLQIQDVSQGLESLKL